MLLFAERRVRSSYFRLSDVNEHLVELDPDDMDMDFRETFV